MPVYKRGQVVNVWFPNDRPGGPPLTPRPCIILDRVSDTHLKFICITKTDRRDSQRGIWIEKNTRDYHVMRLTYPSFINLDSIKELPEDQIKNYRGECLKMEEIDKILSEG